MGPAGPPSVEENIPERNALQGVVRDIRKKILLFGKIITYLCAKTHKNKVQKTIMFYKDVLVLSYYKIIDYENQITKRF